MIWLLVASAWGQASPRPPPPPPPGPSVGDPYVAYAKKRVTMLDVEVRLGIGAALHETGREVSGGLRVAPGIWHERRRALWSVTASYELTDLSPATFGAQLGWMGTTTPNLFFAQIGGLVDVGGRPGASVAVGWGALALETQVRQLPERGRTTAVFLVMRTALVRMGREFGGPSRIR